MAGKSSKAKNKGKVVPPKSSPNESKVETETVQDNSLEQGDSVLTAENNESQDSVDSKHNFKTEEEGTVASVAAARTVAAVAEENGTIDHPTSPDKQANGELQLYAVPVKGPCGEKLELQINPTDSVMDIRQFLLDAPETCFYTCYHLFLKMKDGTCHQLADYSEIGEVGDITTGGCSIEMKTALYDDRSVRAHVRRVRDLVATTNLHTSLSTILAMEFEASHKAHGGEKNKEVPEFEGLGFMQNDESLLENLIVSPSSQEVKCIESIAFSSFNPPPGYRRLVGDLIYLDVSTLEGHSYCITAHTQGFFVNASTANILETKPAKSSHESSSLVGLLRKVSERFRKGFHVLLEKKLSAHPFENVPTWLPLNPWLEVYPPPVHRRDSSRSEDAISLPYGIDPIGMLRDWNEELQSCREFPRQTLQDRILRDRALYKVSCDFVDAAVKGAQGVIHKCIPPINPTDPERFHMYVHNNIFFSFAVDADLAQMQQLFEQKSKEYLHSILKKAEGIESCISTDKNLPEKDTSSSCTLPTDNLEGKDKLEVNSGLSDEAVNHSCHAELDVSSAEKVDSEISDNEQATYASANNDLKGTKAYNNADVAGLYTLAMAIVDYRGHRVVAQSIIPGILQGDKSDSLLYGSVDNGKKISWNEKFHEKVLEAAKVLHIKEHEVIDESGNKIRIAAPVECKGIVGSDDRHYLLDLMRTTPRDANFIGPGTRYYVLRPELITAFCQFEGEERLKQNTSIVSGNSTPTNEEHTNVLLNPNVLTDFKIAGDIEEVSKDEALVRKVGEYLVDVVIPKFVKDLRSLEVSPMDGQTLTEALHAHGINIRYIGKVANMTKNLPHIWDLCVIEMIVRAAKHILKGVLRETKDHDIGGAVSHFFNCFLGHDRHAILNATVVGTASAGDKPRKKGKGVNSKKIGIQTQSESDSTICSSLATSTKDIKKHSNAKSGIHPSYLIITSEFVWIDIKEYAKFKYQFDLPEDARSKVKMSTFRNLCQKIGITIAARKYDLTEDIPFKVSDILDMHAVVKHSAPVCSDARDLIDAGKLQLAEGKLHEAFGLFNEAFLILQQVSGPMHREVANCCRYLAMVLYHAGDMQGAIMQQHKELIINERCLGLDHPDTAHSYGNMALFYHGLNQTELALKHMARTLLLLDVSCGPNHPDVAATFINIAMMYQDIGRMNIALRYLQEALKKNECLLGHDHIQTAVCYHALAIAFNCMGAYKLSVQHEKSTYNVLAKQLGEDDARTQDSANWLKTFQLREAQANAQKQKGHVSDVDATQKALDALKARPALLQAIQASGVPLQSTSQTTVNKAAAAAALMGDMLPRGRGIDERGARAAAEVRRRAVAKGRNVRSKPATAQASSPLTDILSLINAGAGSKVPPTQRDSAVTTSREDATENSQVDSEAKQDLANGSSESNSTNKTEDKAPLGLGTGLDTKKQKARAKAT